METVERSRDTAAGHRRVRSIMVRHPLAAYLVVAYALSWAYWVPLAASSRTTEYGVGWPTHMPGLVGPAISAVIVTGVIGGRAGLADLWRRLTRWQCGRWWWSIPAILAAGAVGLAVTGGVSDTSDLASYHGISSSFGPLWAIALVFVINGVGEELGWRGFLADHLLQRHGCTVTSLLVAVVWALWHIPLFLVSGSFQDFGVAGVVGWAIGLTAGSIVLTWLYRGSGASVLLVALWHTAFNYTSATPAADGAVAAISSTVVMGAAVAVVIVERRLARRSSPPRTSAAAAGAGDGRGCDRCG